MAILLQGTDARGAICACIPTRTTKATTSSVWSTFPELNHTARSSWPSHFVSFHNFVLSKILGRLKQFHDMMWSYSLAASADPLSRLLTSLVLLPLVTSLRQFFWVTPPSKLSVTRVDDECAHSELLMTNSSLHVAKLQYFPSTNHKRACVKYWLYGSARFLVLARRTHFSVISSQREFSRIANDQLFVVIGR